MWHGTPDTLYLTCVTFNIPSNFYFLGGWGWLDGCYHQSKIQCLPYAGFHHGLCLKGRPLPRPHQFRRLLAHHITEQTRVYMSIMVYNCMLLSGQSATVCRCLETRVTMSVMVYSCMQLSWESATVLTLSSGQNTPWKLMLIRYNTQIKIYLLTIMV